MLQLFTLSRLVVLRAMKQLQESASDLLGLMQLSISLVSAVPAVSQAVISLVSLVLIFRLQPDSIFFRQLSRVVRWSEINAIMASLTMQHDDTCIVDPSLTACWFGLVPSQGAGKSRQGIVEISFLQLQVGHENYKIGALLPFPSFCH